MNWYSNQGNRGDVHTNSELEVLERVGVDVLQLSHEGHGELNHAAHMAVRYVTLLQGATEPTQIRCQHKQTCGWIYTDNFLT